MGFHTYDVARADALEDPGRYEYVSVDELLALFDPGGRVLDLGSGTGFYTDDVAPYVGTCYAVDLQPAMHARYREKGVPGNVELVTAAAAALPFADGALDAAVSTMTFHEFATRDSCAELARAVRPGGTLCIADWSRNGTGEEGPPRSERYDVDDAVGMLTAAGFTVDRADERRETFVVRARR